MSLAMWQVVKRVKQLQNRQVDVQMVLSDEMFQALTPEEQVFMSKVLKNASKELLKVTMFPQNRAWIPPATLVK